MKSLTKIVLGFLLMVVVVGVFVGGAVADRLFVIKPIDYFVPRGDFRIGKTTLTQKVLQEESVVIDVAERVAPSVVTVAITQERRVAEPFFMDPFGGFFGPQGTPPSDRTEVLEQDIGSGFVVEGGLVVTNKHVVSQPNATYTVIDRDDNEYEVSNIYRDPLNDLAVLQIAEDLPAVELGDSDNLKVGQFVVAIGTALGEFRHTVTTGVISGLSRGITAGDGLGSSEKFDNVIQTDAAINPGNSGGPLLNSVGQVIGVNTAVSTAGENIGFALPINLLKQSLENFENTGRFDRAFLGVRYRLIPRETALLNDVPAGALIVEVVEGSSAAKADLREGDIIISVAGVQLADEEGGLASIIGSKKIGDTVEVEYWRDGERQMVEVELTGGN